MTILRLLDSSGGWKSTLLVYILISSQCSSTNPNCSSLLACQHSTSGVLAPCKTQPSALATACCLVMFAATACDMHYRIHIRLGTTSFLLCAPHFMSMPHALKHLSNSQHLFECQMVPSPPLLLLSGPAPPSPPPSPHLGTLICI